MNRLTRILERLFIRDAVGAPRHELSGNLTAIMTSNPEYPIILRFRERGSVDYQRLTPWEIRGLQPLLEQSINKDANT